MKNFPRALAERFRQFKAEQFEPQQSHYEQLAEHGQAPEVMIVACSDSRVASETIFNARPGEMFVVRNVAALVPPFETTGNFHGVSAALEFGVLNVRVKHLLVMGHSGCGGIKAALDQKAALETESRFISNWMSMLSDAKLRVLAANQGPNRSALQPQLERAGIRASINNLRTFPFIKQLEDSGELTLHGAHFNIPTGELTILDNETGQFVQL